MIDATPPALEDLQTLEQDLEKYIAKPTATSGQDGDSDPDHWNPENGAKVDPQSIQLLNTISTLLTLTYSISSDVQTVGATIVKDLGAVSQTLAKIADTLGQLNLGNGVNPSDVVTQLQTALAVSQAILPGGSSALASGSQFFAQIANLLTEVSNDIGTTRIILYKVAQQLNAIAAAVTPPPGEAAVGELLRT